MFSFRSTRFKDSAPYTTYQYVIRLPLHYCCLRWSTQVAMWSCRSVRFCKDFAPLRRLSLYSKLCFRSPTSYSNTLLKDKIQGSILKLVLYAPNRKVLGCRHFGSESIYAMYHKEKYGSPDNLVPAENEVLYRFKWTKHLRFISRVKILHVAVVTSLIGPMSYWYLNEVISLYSLTCAIIGAAGTTAGLVALSYFFRRVVGELSFDEDTQRVTISSLTFWGNRRNRTFPLNSLVPLSDSGINVKNTFHRLEVDGCTGVYLLNLRHCKIFHEKFFSVIGLPVDEINLMETGLVSRK